jgi:hypothetical protein
MGVLFLEEVISIKSSYRQGSVEHACNSIFTGSMNSRPAVQPSVRQNSRPYLKKNNNYSNKSWRHSSSGREYLW